MIEIRSAKDLFRISELEATRDALRRALHIEEKEKFAALAELDEVRAENAKLQAALEAWKAADGYALYHIPRQPFLDARRLTLIALGESDEK